MRLQLRIYNGDIELRSAGKPTGFIVDLAEGSIAIVDGHKPGISVARLSRTAVYGSNIKVQLALEGETWKVG